MSKRTFLSGCEKRKIKYIHELVQDDADGQTLTSKYNIETEQNKDTENNVCGMGYELDLKSDYPTDRGKFDEAVTDTLKRSILKFGSCRPSIEFPRTENRCFSLHYYYMVTKGGLKIPRDWLCYSVLLDVAYCETCWLFADRMSGKFNKEWIEGVSDWQHLSQSIQRHEASIQHLYASKVRSLWIKNQTIDINIENQYSQEAMLWRNVLKRIIKIILCLTAGNSGLRGNEGSLKIKNPNEGNFLRTVKLLAEFDPVLNNIMNDEKQNIKYLSPLIQNEIIDILSSDLCRIICDDIRSSCFFSVIIDSTQDITKEDQVSLIIRYTVVDYEKKHIEIRESFLGGQGYDGAAVMSGTNSGVQKRILEIVPNATFVHCCSHNLNLVISDAAKSTREISTFFETVQDVYNFFSSSAPRWSQLALGEEESSKLRKITLKKVCATRWEARHNALFSLKQRFVDVLKAFTRIQLTSTKKDEINIATALKKKLESAEFVLLLCIWEKILKSLFVVSKILQSVSIDLQQAFELLKNAHAEISKLRDEYDTFVDNSKTVCKFWNIPFMFLHKRQRFATKFHDEFDNDRRLTVTEDNFKVTIFNPLIDTTLQKLKERFIGMQVINDNFGILIPNTMITISEEKLIGSSYDFINKYRDDVNSDFTCYCIFMTIPVTSASAERSFSKLKLIKNYLRNTISQDRLNNIAVLNIERLNTSRIDVDTIIDKFANVKARKKNFLK
ncbi:zinc finger MYM-type protein 1-like [Rhopalosiphum maidis]|uniref:zinc finger MYM-type protein 1-like n=1 Tax=Rhopalosiphum maidis TaxID=43146 RepID=UPI000F00C8D7|nr:zinc finger MYM-type protein 1-like [Rhopalosiphum maidis]